MNDKIQKALKRLHDILPLQESQDRCSPQVKALHQQILRSFVERGRILTREEMTTFVDHLPEALELLRQYDMVTLSPNGDPIGAYPFTMSERGHIVHVNGQLLHAMCALDALAIGPMFQERTRITSQCRVTADPIEIWMSGETVQNLEEVGNTHIGIGWAAVNAQSSCADSLCLEMIFLRDKGTAESWLAGTTEDRESFTLQEAVQFASLFFVPLMA